MPWKETNVVNERTEFVLKAMRTDNFRELCGEYGISCKTGYKWRRRFLERGKAGMSDESRKPALSPMQVDGAVACEMVRLKNAHPYWGPKKIQVLYGRLHQPVPSLSTFKRVLGRAGLVKPRRTRKMKQSGGLYSGRKASAPNEVWTVDFKGWWYSAGSGRCEPLTVRDEYTRYVLDIRVVANGRTETVRECFERLFEQNGVPAAIRSDNGAPFASSYGILGLSRLSAWWVVLGIDLERGRPACPQDNGAHERLHLDMARELERQSVVDQQAAMDVWRKTFNEERPHEALGMRCPGDLYARSDRRYEGTPDDLEYPGMVSRRVHRAGYIVWQQQQIWLSHALAGWSVGLQRREHSKWDVWFGRVLLGQFDAATMSFTRRGMSET